MMRVCAWCKATMDNVTAGNVEDFSITHGICQPCADRLHSERGIQLSDFLDRLNTPVAVVDSDGVIQTANKRAQTILGKELKFIEGFRGGEVFECVYSSLPEGCGKTLHCSGCTIRRAVMETYSTGKSISRRPAYLNHKKGDTLFKVSLLISTEKVGGVVLLAIDRVDAAQPAL